MHVNLLFDEQEIREYWNRKVVHFRNTPHVSTSFPNISELISQLNGLFDGRIWHSPVSLPINVSRVHSDLSYDQVLSISLAEAQRHYSNGFSLCFSDLTPHIESIGGFKRAVASAFGHENLINITAYLSPPEAVGLLHFDRQHNYFIQKSGVKRWYVSEKPAVINPPENFVYLSATKEIFEEKKANGYAIKFPSECGVKVFELQPGDILYVPPGYYHSPETADTASLHYTLTLEPACVWKDFSGFLNEELFIGNEDYYMDYRFLSPSEKNELVKRCHDRLVMMLKKRLLR